MSYSNVLVVGTGSGERDVTLFAMVCSMRSIDRARESEEEEEEVSNHRWTHGLSSSLSGLTRSRLSVVNAENEKRQVQGSAIVYSMQSLDRLSERI